MIFMSEKEHLPFEEQILKQVKKDTEATRKDIKRHSKEVSKYKKQVRRGKAGKLADIYLAPPFLYSQQRATENKLKKSQLRLAQAKVELKILKQQAKALRSKRLRALEKIKHAMYYVPERFFVKQKGRGFELAKMPKAIYWLAGRKTKRVK